MNFKSISDKAKKKVDDALEQRGGKESIKRDAGQVRDALKSPGSLQEKTRRVTDAIKRPG